MIFRKIPKCSDKEYVELIFNDLFNHFKMMNPIVKNDEIPNDLIDYINYLFLSFKIEPYNIQSCEEIIGDRSKLPIIMDLNFKDDVRTIFITPFGFENIEITKIELLLIMLEEFVIKNNLIIPKEILENQEQLKCYLMVAGIYFGFGFFFLERFFINGRYKYSDEYNSFRIGYPLPLNIDFAIYAFALSKEYTSIWPNYNYKNLSNSIEKEIHICFKYLKRNSQKNR
jgi:hypothetical protein